MKINWIVFVFIKSLNQSSKQHAEGSSDPSIVDPAILGASSSGGGPTVVTTGNKSQSIWGDMPARISPNNAVNMTPPTSISPINSLLQSGQANQLAAMIAGVDNATAAAILAQQLGNANAGGAQYQMLNDNVFKNKIQALFEQTKKEEERKRKMEEEYQLKVSVSSKNALKIAEIV